VIAVFFIPMFFYVLETMSEKRDSKKTPGASGGPEGGAHPGPVPDPAKPAGSGGPTVTPSAQREGD
jgi:multidrug efflux pump